MRGSKGSATGRSAGALGAWLILLLCLLTPAVHAQSTPTPLDLARYVAQLHTAQAALAKEPTSATVEQLQAELSAVTSIVLPSGEIITPAPLFGAATAEPLAVDEAQQRLALLIKQLDAAAQDHTAARLAILAEILQRPAFVGQESLWERFWRWLRQWFPELGANERQAGPGWLGAWATVLGWVILGVAAILLIWLLSIWLQNLLASFVQSDGERALGHGDAEPQTATQARQQAQQLANAGSFREAVRRMYLAALLTLHERNLLYYDRSNTNREVLATVRHQPTLYAHLQPLVETFDDVWYGVHEPDRATFDRYVQAVQGLEELS